MVTQSWFSCQNALVVQKLFSTLVRQIKDITTALVEIIATMEMSSEDKTILYVDHSAIHIITSKVMHQLDKQMTFQRWHWHVKLNLAADALACLCVS